MAGILIDADFDDRELQKQFQRLKDNFGIDLDPAINRQMRLLLRDVQNWTPPHRGKGGSTLKDRAQGRLRIREDMLQVYANANRVFQILRDRGGPKGKGLAKIAYSAMVQGDLLRLEELLQNSVLAGIPIVSGPSRNLHDQARNSRGRVRRMNLPAQIVVSKTTLDSSIEQVQALSGLAKLGWEPGIAGSGGRSPAWVRSAGIPHGTFQAPSAKDERPAVARNTSKSIGSLQDRLIRTSIQRRVRSLRNEIDGALRDEWRRAHLIKAHG